MKHSVILALAVAALGAAGCKQSPKLHPLGSATGGSSTGGSAGGAGAFPGGAGGWPSNTGGTSASAGHANAGGSGGAEPANVVNVVDVAATSCVAPASPGTLVLDSGAAVPVFDRLGQSGARLYALSRTDRTFFQADADGGQVSSFLGGVVAATGDGSGVTVAFGTTPRLFLQRYDEWMVPVGSSAEVAQSASCGASLAPLGGRTAVAWVDAGALHARIVDSTASTSVDVAVPNAADGVKCWTSMAATETGVALTWTRSSSDGTTQTLWSMIISDGRATAPVTVFSTGAPHEVAGMVRTASGFALAINETGTKSAFVLLRTDISGAPQSPAYRFLGTGAADDLAARGDEAAITGSLADGREVLRVVAPGVVPTEVPSCLDDNPADGSFVGHASVLSDATGYTILARHRNGSAWLERRDAP